MDSLNDILSLKDFDQPVEVTVIKNYVRKEFNATVAVTVREREIIIFSRSAAMTNALRLRTLAFKKILADDKRRLVFRIGK